MDDHGHGKYEYLGAPVPKKMNRIGALGPAIKGFFYPEEKKPPVEHKKHAELSGKK